VPNDETVPHETYAMLSEPHGTESANTSSVSQTDTNGSNSLETARKDTERSHHPERDIPAGSTEQCGILSVQVSSNHQPGLLRSDIDKVIQSSAYKERLDFGKTDGFSTDRIVSST
jgi:hypothetical protein